MVDLTAHCWKCGEPIEEDEAVFAARVEMALPSIVAGTGTIFCVDCAIALEVKEVERFLYEAGGMARNAGELQERIEAVYLACRADRSRRAALRELKGLATGQDDDGSGA